MILLEIRLWGDRGESHQLKGGNIKVINSFHPGPVHPGSGLIRFRRISCDAFVFFVFGAVEEISAVAFISYTDHKNQVPLIPPSVSLAAPSGESQFSYILRYC